LKKHFVAQIFIFLDEEAVDKPQVCLFEYSSGRHNVLPSRTIQITFISSVGYLLTRGSYDPNSHVLNGFAANAFQYGLQNSTNITAVHKFNGII
jgi:hypothetical protein